MNYSMCAFIRATAACFVLLLIAGALRAQATNTFPLTGPAGIGTTSPKNALHLNFSSNGHNDTAIIRLSNDTTSSVYGILGLMPYTYPYYSSISKGEDLILHEHSQGDLILTNFQSYSASHPYGAIRMATTPSAGSLPAGAVVQDYERMTILPNGNVGIDLPPDAGIFAGLGNPKDQVQIGGGSIPPPTYDTAVPGLTMYGGNRFEGMLLPFGPGTFPFDWRYLAFNYATNHVTNDSNRNFRLAPMASSAIKFADASGGTILLNAWPYDSTKGTSSIARGIYMGLYGQQGIDIWSDESDSDQYHHLFDIWRPHVMAWDSLRNDSGLAMFHVPVYIGGGPTWYTPNFTDLTNVRPGIGDGHTWQLAVNGPALFKEAWVIDTPWSDYVFLPDYKLMTIENFGKFMITNHHLPEIPDAKTMAHGVPLGKTEADLTKQMEEMALYIVQLHKQNDALTARLEKVEAEMKELKSGKVK
jgi:hypothetical protein